MLVVHRFAFRVQQVTPPSMSTPTYFLNQHAHFCATKRYWLILDLTCDRYLCIDRERLDLLGPWLQGWQTSDKTAIRDRSEALPAEAAQLARELVAKGILSESSKGTKALHEPALDSATDALIDDSADRTVKLPLAHATTFLLACARADYALRHRPIAAIVRTAHARKQQSRWLQPTSDFARIRDLVSIYNALRLLYPRDYLCMFDSLSLLNFLFAHRAGATWVFGVSADPFKAHCWLQSGSTLLNDTIARVSSYTPIMCV